MALRQIPSRVLTLEEIGAPRVFQKIAELERGLVIVAGPAATGKSTTLAAMIDHINRTRAQHVITIEDPIEFVHTPMKCLVNQREVGRHTASFASGLRSAMREDPGRDPHRRDEGRRDDRSRVARRRERPPRLRDAPTSSATETIDRIIGIHPPDQHDYVRSLLAGTLQPWWRSSSSAPGAGQGRIAVHEILVGHPRGPEPRPRRQGVPDPERAAELQGRGHADDGDGAKALVTRNRITREQAIDASGNPRMFEHDEPGGVRRGTSSSV
jgi:twitching motility protein PilT